MPFISASAHLRTGNRRRQALAAVERVVRIFAPRESAVLLCSSYSAYGLIPLDQVSLLQCQCADIYQQQSTG